MNNILFSCSIALTALTVLAQERPTSVAQIINRESGGMITTTFKGTKKVYYINAQKRASDALIDSARMKMEAALKTPIDTATGTFDITSPTIMGELSLYIIDDEKLPLSLIAPEGRWAFVNVAHLAKGRGEKKPFFEARVRKEMARIGCMLLGNIGTQYKDNLMSFVGSAEELDRFESDELPIDGPVRCSRYLLNLGVKPYRRIPYRKACIEGWAPTPTNDIQKAIWDKVHELPTKPIKILPETKPVKD